MCIHATYKSTRFFKTLAMDEEEEVAVVAIIVSAVILSKKIRKKRKRRSAWVKPWLQRRSSHGFYTQLLNELRLEEGEIYENYLRMNAENFDHILSLVRAHPTDILAFQIQL